MTSRPMDDIRRELSKFAGSTPPAGPDFIAALNRIRSWTFDMAEAMVPLYLSVNDFEMDMTSDLVDDAIGYARSEAEKTPEEYHMYAGTYRDLLRELPKAVAEALHYEEAADYSVSYGASRAALQAIQAAVSSPDDFDMFSLVIRAQNVAEQCVLAEAYRNLAREIDGPATPKQIRKAIVEASSERGAIYMSALAARLYENVRVLNRDDAWQETMPGRS